jgi:hypothetical protein
MVFLGEFSFINPTFCACISCTYLFDCNLLVAVALACCCLVADSTSVLCVCMRGAIHRHVDHQVCSER